MKGISTTSDPHINFYLEDTPEWLALGAKGRLLWPHLVRVCQLNGCLHFEGLTPEEALSKRLRFPQAFIKEALADLTAGDDPWVEITPRLLVIPEYHNVIPHEADECPFVLRASPQKSSKKIGRPKKSVTQTNAQYCKSYRERKKAEKERQIKSELTFSVATELLNLSKSVAFRDDCDGHTSGANPILPQTTDLHEIVKSVLQELVPQLLSFNVTYDQACIQNQDGVLPLTSSTISDAYSRGQPLVARSRSQAVETSYGVSTSLSNKFSFSLDQPACSEVQLSVPFTPDVLDRSTDLVKEKKQPYKSMGPRIRDENYLLILSTYNKFLKKINPRARGCGDNQVSRELIERPFGYLNLSEEEVTDLWLRVIEAQAINVLTEGKAKAKYFNLKTLNCPDNFERLQSMADVLIEEPTPDYRDIRKYENEIERSYVEGNRIAPEKAAGMAAKFLADVGARSPHSNTDSKRPEPEETKSCESPVVSQTAPKETGPIDTGLVTKSQSAGFLAKVEPTIAELTADLKAISQMLEHSVPMHETKTRAYLIRMSSQIEDQIKYKMRPAPPEAVEPELRPGEIDWREKFKQGSEMMAKFLAGGKSFS